MLNLKNSQTPKTNKMTPTQIPQTKNSLISDIKQLATIVAIIMIVVFLLTISEDKSNLKQVQAVNVQAQSEKALTPEQEINKLKLELDIKQKQAELEKLTPKAQPPSR